MKSNIKRVIVVAALMVLPALAVHAQGFERVSLGANGVVWGTPDLDDFSLAFESREGNEVYELDESVLFGVRPFVRLGLTRQLAVELSHEFAFGDEADIMVSSGTGIWRPFGESGLELHGSICYGQLDWDGPGDFDSAWGWEAGGAYTFRISESVYLLAGVAYRDLSFDYRTADLQEELKETRPDVFGVGLSKDSVDSAGVVGSVGVFVTF